MKLKEEIPTIHSGNHRLHRLPVLALLPILLAAGAPHAYPAQAQALKAVRVEKGPSLDPALSDPAWAQAVAFTGFTMVFPNPGEAPTERTELRIVYDATDLYVGVRCFDREPDRIAGNTMLHDGNEEDEGKGNDEVRVLLDPFRDKRNAYVFVVNPRGARSEGLAGGEHLSLNWDGIWDARCAIGRDGWSCVMRIPFKTIAFKPGLEAWGVNVERYIARKQETDRLAWATRNSFFYNPAEAVPLEGIGGVAQGTGLTFRPFGILGVDRDASDGRATDATPDAGFDIYKSFTPNFVGAFSFNTDFAETEVDERRINLTRFPLYFPEKRTFFLEGSEIFAFGPGGQGESFSPFFSRRIGLYEESRIPVSFGAKVYGRLGDTSLSVLDVGTRRFADDDLSLSLAAQNFFAARVSQNILEESRFGFIFTNGSPTGGRNTLAGADFTFKTSRFLGDRNLLLGGWAVYNWNEKTAGRHEGWGLRLDFPNDLWDIRASYVSYGDALDPGLGFLNRNGVRTMEVGLAYQPRPEQGLIGALVRQFFFEMELSFYWDLAGRLETREIFTAPLNLRTESGEHIEFNVIPQRDVLPYAFEIAPGVVLPRGPYDFVSYRFELNTAPFRPWTLDVSWRFGGFYSGTYDDAQIGFGLKFGGNISLAFSAEMVRGRLPQGRFSENVYQVKADLFLTPDLGLMNYIQYDDQSKTLGAQVRFRWRISPGNELFLVYSKNWERRWDPESRFAPLGERGVFKVTFSVRP